MTQTILELATITLADGKSEAELLRASEAFQSEFLDHQDGFLRRDMVRRADGTFTDIILWESRAKADAVFERAMQSEAAGGYFAHMKIDPEKMDEGVEHCAVLRSFKAEP
ncbi:hypothetical protein AB3Y40_01815 [Yoonia sp. R2331]|uniref:hypothetical protein n=1 Tax=Yoonia sp. R2331 TaxID=3237238 RepID=UPI0034E537D6